MSKIKEIKKLGKEIKEIKKSEESLEEEIEEEELEQFSQFISGRRRNVTSTLAQTESPQEVAAARERIAKEDTAEINFRPSYTGGGNPYSANTYTPVGSAESSIRQTQVGLERQRQDRDIAQSSAQEQGTPWRGAANMEATSERAYVSSQDQKRKKDDF